MMHWLKFRKIKLVKTTVLSLVILKGVSFDSANFEVSKVLLILFSIFSLVAFRKEDTLLFVFL